MSGCCLSGFPGAAGCSCPEDGYDVVPGYTFVPTSQTSSDIEQSFKGAAYTLIHRIRSNRMVVQITTAMVDAELRFLLYQAAGGVSAAEYALVADFVVSAAAAGLFEVAPVGGGDFRLARGLFFALYGNPQGDTGTPQVRSYNTGAIDLLYAPPMAANTYRDVFSTALDSDSTPATIDPSTFTEAASADFAAVFRFKRV